MDQSAEHIITKMKVSTLACVHSTDEHLDNMLVHGLKSVLNQTRPVDEIIVVLDECWKRTRSALEKHFQPNDMKVVSKSPKNGLAAAKNYGLQYCSGDWITFLDADDAWMPCKNEVQSHSIMRSAQPADFVGALAWDRWPKDDKPVEEWPLTPSCFRPGEYQSHDEIKNKIFHENVLCHGSMMIKSHALMELGGYRDVRGAEDWDLWRRAINAGYKFFNLPERLYIWTHGTSVER